MRVRVYIVLDLRKTGWEGEEAGTKLQEDILGYFGDIYLDKPKKIKLMNE
jgi:hypothetical protein